MVLINYLVIDSTISTIQPNLSRLLFSSADPSFGLQYSSLKIYVQVSFSARNPINSLKWAI